MHHHHGELENDPARIRASTQLDELEQQADRSTLLALADFYHDRAELARGYAAVLVQAQRLTEARAAYDRLLSLSSADGVAEQLTARGLVLFDPETGSSATALSDAAAVFTQLARIALEAANPSGQAPR